VQAQENLTILGQVNNYRLKTVIEGQVGEEHN
jgi:hypothetical protein